MTKINEVNSCYECMNYIYAFDKCTLDDNITVEIELDLHKDCPLPSKEEYCESNFNPDK